MGALDLDLVELFVVDNEVGVLGDRVALGLIFVFDDVARLGVDKLAFHPVAGLAIDGVERDARR